MILRRLATAFRQQDWFTVMVEILIVVLGVFIGIQVANWNDARIDAGRAAAYLERIVLDLDADLATLAHRKDFWRQVSRYGETGLRYAESGLAEDTSHWAVLLAYFQASQVAEFITTQATYDELRSAGDLELISNLEIRNKLARYYNFGAAPTVVERPRYREHVRGIIPMDIQAYIWDSCYESNATGFQRMFDCPPPVDDETAHAVVDTLAGNALLMEELRYWMSTMHVAQLIANDRVAGATALKSMITANSQLVQFQQYTDTAALAAAMAAPSNAGVGTQSHGEALEQIALVPADRSLVRPEDGVMLTDGALLIADQIHGLVHLAPDGAKRPFGDFAAAGYVHQPPARAAGPNGVAMEPDGIHVLVADILTGAIYRINTETEQVVRIHQHEFGANSARRDSSGALWFTQSTGNRAGPDSEARMFAAVDEGFLDGALYRLPPPADGTSESVAELKLSGLTFGNGVAIDEARGRIYIAETMANRIVGYRMSLADGRLSEGRVVAELPSPDNIELDAAGRLWVASPIANALLVVDPDSGGWSTVFHPQTAEHDQLMIEWQRRTETGEPRLELFGPDMWSPLPGLITGLILTHEGGPIYLTGLGDALVKLEISE